VKRLTAALYSMSGGDKLHARPIPLLSRDLSRSASISGKTGVDKCPPPQFVQWRRPRTRLPRRDNEVSGSARRRLATGLPTEPRFIDMDAGRARTITTILIKFAHAACRGVGRFYDAVHVILVPISGGTNNITDLRCLLAPLRSYLHPIPAIYTYCLLAIECGA